MEQQQQFNEERHYGGVSDHCLQPAWLCVPQIKVENDLGIYHCQASQSNHLSTSNSASDFSQLECNSNYMKTGSLSTSQSEYCENRRLTDNTGYIKPNNASDPQQPSAGLPPCLDQSSTASSYVSPDLSSEHHVTDMQTKDSKYDSVTWCIEPPQVSSHQLPQKFKVRFYNSHEEDTLDKDERDDEVDACESRQAFDLTCRNKTPSREEDTSCNESPLTVTEEQSGTQAQAKYTPKPQTCKICGKVLSSPSSYYVHMKLHSGNKPYACSLCEASFCRKPYLEVHMRTHTGERPFECKTCNKRFTQKSSLNTHKRVHTGERPYACDICQKTFAVKSYVTAHRWSHVSEKPLECQHCGLTFTSKNLYALHTRTHTDQNHECLVCGRTFMKDSYLIRHQNKVHRDISASYSDITEPRSPAQSPSSSISS